MLREDLATSVLLKILVSDGTDYSSVYEEYTLTGVTLRESFATTPEMTDKNTVDVYFHAETSKCVNSSGTVVPLPCPSYGDRCVIHTGGNERELRVASVKRMNGVKGHRHDLSHIIIRLN